MDRPCGERRVPASLRCGQLPHSHDDLHPRRADRAEKARRSQDRFLPELRYLHPAAVQWPEPDGEVDTVIAVSYTHLDGRDRAQIHRIPLFQTGQRRPA